MQQKNKCLNMVRKLLLIISDGGGNSPLRGVHIDKKNFLNFFKSPEGGAGPSARAQGQLCSPL